MDIDKLEGRELDAAVAEKVMDWHWNDLWGSLIPREQTAMPSEMWTEWHEDEDGLSRKPIRGNTVSGLSYNGDLFKINLPHYSTDIAAAWLVDKPGWYWIFHEALNHLQITLYPSKELYHKRPWDLQPYPKGIICVKVNWDERKTKAEVYALGRCRAALKAMEEK